MPGTEDDDDGPAASNTSPALTAAVYAVFLAFLSPAWLMVPWEAFTASSPSAEPLVAHFVSPSHFAGYSSNSFSASPRFESWSLSNEGLNPWSKMGGHSQPERTSLATLVRNRLLTEPLAAGFNTPLLAGSGSGSNDHFSPNANSNSNSDLDFDLLSPETGGSDRGHAWTLWSMAAGCWISAMMLRRRTPGYVFLRASLLLQFLATFALALHYQADAPVGLPPIGLSPVGSGSPQIVASGAFVWLAFAAHALFVAASEMCFFALVGLLPPPSNALPCAFAVARLLGAALICAFADLGVEPLLGHTALLAAKLTTALMLFRLRKQDQARGREGEGEGEAKEEREGEGTTAVGTRKEAGSTTPAEGTTTPADEWKDMSVSRQRTAATLTKHEAEPHEAMPSPADGEKPSSTKPSSAIASDGQVAMAGLVGALITPAMPSLQPQNPLLYLLAVLVAPVTAWLYGRSPPFVRITCFLIPVTLVASAPGLFVVLSPFYMLAGTGCLLCWRQKVRDRATHDHATHNGATHNRAVHVPRATHSRAVDRRSVRWYWVGMGGIALVFGMLPVGLVRGLSNGFSILFIGLELIIFFC
ncbi:putative transmembrane protein [Gregarina niphandrodes]|uniref:Transmembrane protein n=1 Tax=Gregarina niphandrodes TaxID=110365 RepID=A0A023B043_GRENI|nr:putative transmembrane protein [Gregarina niphandrodes]EZG44983.1 putative transmembrane protein [Gregarina niphandrodes]|eukprot:XP_011132609.1 putative transmembrane protein [Gregarina niphandrodes]